MATIPDAGRLLAHLRFRHLQMLAALDQTGGVRRAAERLNLTQPAISKALTELEGAFGFALFERTRRGLIPTAQGHVVLRGAAVLVNEARQLHAEAQAAEANEGALLRIGTIPFIALSLLPRVLAALASRSRLRAVIEEGAVPPLVDRLRHGDLDALITTYSPVLDADQAGGLAWESLFVERAVIIAAANHPLARRRKLSWTEIAREPWVLPGRRALIRQAIEGAFRRAGLTPPEPTIECTAAPTNLQLIAAGLGIGAVPEAVIRTARRPGAVVQLAVEPTIDLPQVSLVYHRIATDQDRIVRLREAIHSVLGKRSRRKDGWQILPPSLSAGNR